jgi:hypothetical protein
MNTLSQALPAILIPGLLLLAARATIRRHRLSLSNITISPMSGAILFSLSMVLCWLLTITSLLLVQSIKWPLVLDAPLMNYAALQIRNGGVPYRDVFDMNMPGTYLIHLLAVGLGANTDLGWRMFDLTFLTLTCAGIWLHCRSLCPAAGYVGSLFYAAYHLSDGPINAGQRDYFLFGFLMLAAALSAESVELKNQKQCCVMAAAAGVCGGFALWIKPTALVYMVTLLLLCWRQPTDENRLSRKWYLSGAVMPSVVIVLWLAVCGGLGPFVTIMRQFVGPIYQHLVERSFLESVILRTNVLIPCVVCLCLGFMFQKKELRERLLLAGCGYGLAHFILQGKGFGYHLYPLAGFTCALVATWIRADLMQAEAPRQWARAFSIVGFSLWLGCWSGRLDPAMAHTQILTSYVSSLTRDLRERLPADGRIQVLDTATGGIDALMPLNLTNATPYMYDFPFFYGGNSPYIRGIQMDFMRRMTEAPPDIIVVTRIGWPRGQYERLQTFSEFASWLDTHYRVVIEREQYRLYVR